MVHTPRFFSSKCSLFHNSNVFGSCIIHILYTVCVKIKKNNSGGKSLVCGTNIVQLKLDVPSIVQYSGRTAQLTSKVPFYIFIQQI